MKYMHVLLNFSHLLFILQISLSKVSRFLAFLHLQNLNLVHYLLNGNAHSNYNEAYSSPNFTVLYEVLYYQPLPLHCPSKKLLKFFLLQQVSRVLNLGTVVCTTHVGKLSYKSNFGLYSLINQLSTQHSATYVHHFTEPSSSQFSALILIQSAEGQR